MTKDEIVLELVLAMIEKTYVGSNSNFSAEANAQHVVAAYNTIYQTIQTEK